MGIIVYQVDLKALQKQKNDYPVVMIPVVAKDLIFPQLAATAMAQARIQPLSTLCVHHLSHLHGLDMNDLTLFNNFNECPSTVRTCNLDKTAAYNRKNDNAV